MRIGKDGYDIEDSTVEERRMAKLEDEVEKDWEECDNKEEILKGYDPCRIGQDDSEGLYNVLTWEQKLEIYLDRNPEKRMNPGDYPQ